jgi:hypothetical protein
LKKYLYVQPIATGKMLLTGKGMFDIKFNLGGISKKRKGR